jgi:hypothetical protein
MTRREQRKAGAALRQQAYEALSLQERIDRAKSRPGNSGKELLRLRKQLRSDYDDKRKGPKRPRRRKGARSED